MKNIYSKITAVLALLLVVPMQVAAQQEVIDGMEIIKNYFGGSHRDIREIISLLINQVLGLLGIVAVCIVIFAGFQYMMSFGEEEKLHTAKQTLYNGIVGILIILTSYSLANFVISSILNAT